MRLMVQGDPAGLGWGVTANMLEGELQRAESQFVRVYRPNGREQLATGRLLVKPEEPTAGFVLYPNRRLAEGEYMLTSMSGARQWPVVLRRDPERPNANVLLVQRLVEPPSGSG